MLQRFISFLDNPASGTSSLWYTEINASRDLLNNRDAAVAALTVAIKSAVYIASSRDADIEFGYSEEAPRPLVVAASGGDFGAVEKLAKLGFSDDQTCRPEYRAPSRSLKSLASRRLRPTGGDTVAAISWGIPPEK